MCRDVNVCDGCGAEHGRVTLHTVDCAMRQRELELAGLAPCACPMFYVGTDDGMPLVVIKHTSCRAAMLRCFRSA